MRSLPRPVAFWAVVGLLVLMLAASGVPTPLYRVYAAEFGFDSGLLTLVFAVYAFALLLALVTVGALSDHVGRRPVLAAALAVEAAAMALFWTADGVGWLLAARIVQGLATGALTATLGAAALDLQNPRRPLGALANTAAPGIGLSLGGLGAAVAVQYLTEPTSWIFGVLTVACLGAAAAVYLVLPETSPRLPGAVASLRPSIEVAPARRPLFLAVAPCLVATWAVGGLYGALGPSLIADVFGVTSPLAGGLLLLAIYGTGLVGTLTLRLVRPDLAMTVGALVFAAGVGGTVAALALDSVVLFYAATTVAGYGFGGAFLGAMSTLTRDVPPGQRAALLAAVFTVSYLAFALPAIAAGLASAQVGLRLTTEIYAAAVVVLALAAVVGLRVAARRPPVVSPG